MKDLVVESLVSEELFDNELGVMDLGAVSEETQGSWVGHSYDGGFGVRLP